MNKRSLNVQKTHTMTFSNTYSISERNNSIYKIYTVNKIKFLILLINNKLNWSDHIKYVSDKISKNWYYKKGDQQIR